jgi:hypothetical protein
MKDRRALRTSSNLITVKPQAKAAGPLPDYPWPHDQDAERAVLGEVLLVGTDCFQKARAHCEPADFFLDAHREIFAAMDEFAREGAAIDCLTVYGALKKSPAVEYAGGLAYLGTLKSSETTASNVAHYAKIVSDKARLRQLMNAAAVLYARASADDQPVSEIVGDGEKLLAGIAAANGNCGFLDLFDTPDELEDAAPLSFAIENFLQLDGATVIAGLVGSYKTFLSLSITKALLDERIEKLWDTFPVLHKADRVIYLIPESARGPFNKRLALMGLGRYVRNRKLLVRTLNKGPILSLQNPRFLAGIRGAHIVLDTGVRFMTGNENEAGDAARGLSADILAMIAAGAASVIVLLHSPKGFETATYMSIENMIRGTSELGAPFVTGWGIRQLPGDVAHIQNIKPRDFEPCGPFQLLARPSIDQTGDFTLHRMPGNCGPLAEEIPDSMRNRNNKGGGQPNDKREAKTMKLAFLDRILTDKPHATETEIQAKFAEIGIEVALGSIRGYKSQLRKSKE